MTKHDEKIYFFHIRDHAKKTVSMIEGQSRKAKEMQNE